MSLVGLARMSEMEKALCWFPATKCEGGDDETVVGECLSLLSEELLSMVFLSIFDVIFRS